MAEDLAAILASGVSPSGETANLDSRTRVRGLRCSKPSRRSFARPVQARWAASRHAVPEDRDHDHPPRRCTVDPSFSHRLGALIVQGQPRIAVRAWAHDRTLGRFRPYGSSGVRRRSWFRYGARPHIGLATRNLPDRWRDPPPGQSRQRAEPISPRRGQLDDGRFRYRPFRAHARQKSGGGKRSLRAFRPG